jgi:predicted deacylase
MNRDSQLIYEAYNKKEVVIVSGIHGDEPAGNYAARYFSDNPRILVIDNINGSGKRRLNGKDINRQFGKDTDELADTILQTILDVQPRLVISLHEDTDADKPYAYCSESLTSKLQSIFEALDIDVLEGTIYGDKLEKGVVVDSKQHWSGTLESQLEDNDILYCTIETPTNMDLKERVGLQIKIVKALLN